MNITPTLLVILDGFGCREDSADNAIANARTPNWDDLVARYPHTTINASEDAVGLPEHQMGNSEVGHLNIGAGRVVYQEYTRINRAIESGTFFRNEALLKAIHHARTQGGRLHVLGLLSNGGVHSHVAHIEALIDLAAREGVRDICLHAFLDGRDTAPRSALTWINRVDTRLKVAGAGRIASVIGRYFAMDRDHRWSRIAQAYNALVHADAPFTASTAQAAVEAAYARGETDEFLQATVIFHDGRPEAPLSDNDAIVFMNFRSDRARQLTTALLDEDFIGFNRGDDWKPPACMVTLTGYADRFEVPVAFPPENIRNGFGEYLSNCGLKQLRIAETEKYAHVTFFFNGGIETPFPGENRILVPSPSVDTYDQKPEMSAYELSERLCDAIKKRDYAAIICNYANADMVGHTGNLSAATLAIEALDTCIGQIVRAMLRQGGEVLITADHGNAEQMADPSTHQRHTAHTCNEVPLLYIGRPARLMTGGALQDVAPTLLKIMGLPQPQEMTGRALVVFDE